MNLLFVDNIKYLFHLLFVMVMLLTACFPRVIYIQKEERRNQSTEWQLVWEDDFNTAALGKTIGRRIGLL
jgi:hypothetical protein